MSQLPSTSVSAESLEQMPVMQHLIVLRQYLLQTAIEQAQQGDASGVQELAQVMSRPYDEQPEYQAYAALPPDWAAGICVSCSS